MKDEIRTVNRVLGIEPKIGSFSLYQILPIGALGVAVVYGAVAVQMNVWAALALWGILSAVYLIVMGDKPWLTLSRLYVPPTVIRAGVRFCPIQEIPAQRKRSHRG